MKTERCRSVNAAVWYDGGRIWRGEGRYGAPAGVRRAGFDTAGFDAREGVSIEAELVVAAGATCGIATTPFRAISAGWPLTRWTVA